MRYPIHSNLLFSHSPRNILIIPPHCTCNLISMCCCPCNFCSSSRTLRKLTIKTWSGVKGLLKFMNLVHIVSADEVVDARTSVTHLEQAISLVKCKNVSRLIGCAAIYFSCLGRKYNIGLGRKCLTFNIVTRNFWADKLCSKIS